MSTLISALDKSADEVSKNCANECAEIHTCTECHKKGCFCDNIEKCDRCGWAVCGECDAEGKQIDDDWVCGGCQDEEEKEDDDAKSANSSTYGEGCRRICRMCGEECSCWNYNDEHEVVCEDCGESEEEEVITFNCAECDVKIIKDSRAHDNALTHDGKRLWCMDCYDAWKAHKDCPPENDNDESKCGCDSNECAECQCDTCGECTMPENKACHHAKFGKFCVCE
jgi:hypothetical protein